MQAHFKLQQATLQYERANSRQIYARQRVQEAENRVFSSGEKRAFDTALQEMLNQATIEVNFKNFKLMRVIYICFILF